MKKLFILIICFITVVSLSGQGRILFYNGNNVIYNKLIENVDSVNFTNNVSIVHNNIGDAPFQFPVVGIDSITFISGDVPEDTSRTIYIIYNGNDVTVINPLANQGINITTNGADVTVNGNSGIQDVTYHLSGTTTDGSLVLSSDERFNFIFSGVNITNPTGAAIKVLLDVKVSVTLDDNTTSSLSDGSSSADKAAFESKGQLLFSGNGVLNVAGVAKHGIFSSDYIRILSGTINVTSAYSDGLHGDYFQMYGGTVDITANSSGIDGDTGFIEIYDGNITIHTTQNDGKSMKCDSTLTINGGTLNLTVSGAQAKGLKSGQSIILNGGDIHITASGATVLSQLTTGYEPSYCSALKSDNTVIINDGTQLTITCPSSNNGGKGISADGNITINGGTVNITTAGAGATYTNSSNTTGSYTSSCIKSDAAITINAGNITCSSSGSGGKGITCDGALTIGVADAANENLVLNVSTSGERFQVSSGGGGGGFPPGGNSGDYANPKAIKSLGNLTINSGTITVTCHQSNEGGEGIESKNELTINGGLLEVTSDKDDAINAANKLTINGGMIYAASAGNDGIDCNGSMYINGGLAISAGSSAPEEGFDCDQNTFQITGGIIVGTGGATSSPTSGSSQKSIKYNATSGNAICIYNSNNTPILTMQLPTLSGGGGGFPGGGGSGMVMLFSDPNLVSGSYTLKYGGTITGGTDFHGYYSNASFSGGSSKSFTISNSVVTTVQ